MIKGKNNKGIPVEIEYLYTGEIKVKEKNHTVEYIENIVPRQVAEVIYTNGIVANTYFLLEKIEPNQMKVFINAWQAYYNLENKIYYVMEYTNYEVWTRINE